MDSTFTRNLRVLRRRILAFWLAFAGAVAALLLDLTYISSVRGDPGVVASYLIAVFIAVILGMFPVLAFLLNRWVRELGVAECPRCNQWMWPNTVVATTTALLRICPRCHGSLRALAGPQLTSACSRDAPG
jgi:hypothetical protein